MELHEDDKLNYENIKSIIQEVLRIKPERITPKAKLFSDLGAESLDVLDLKFRLEKAYSLVIDDNEIIAKLGEGITAQEINELFTVESVLFFVKNKLSYK